MATPRVEFVEWKQREQLTDEQIAIRLRARGQPVSRQMIGLLLSGDRNAGGDLAIALAEMTGLAVRLFITKPQPVPSTNRVTTPTGPTCQLNAGPDDLSAEPRVVLDQDEPAPAEAE